MIAAATDAFASNNLLTSHNTSPVRKTLMASPMPKKNGATVSKRWRLDAS